MRRSELLTRLAGHSPCLLCEVAAKELSERGKDDAAFVLPVLARIVWGAAKISEDERVALNEMLSRLLRCSTAEAADRAQLLRDLRPGLLQIAEQDTELMDICVEFLTSFGDDYESG